MPRWLIWLSGIVAVLLVLAAGAYWWLFLESGSPDQIAFIDLDEARRLSDAMPGEKPSSIRVEQIGVLTFPSIVIMAGDSWDTEPMEVFSYQIVYPDGRSVIADTGFDKKAADAMNASYFDQGAFDRMSAALAEATIIVVTHEHPDHLGGLVAQPNLAALLEHTMLTTEQVENKKGLEPSAIPDGLNILRVGYERYDAVLPGVVLIKSPGHTPGSQMIFVQTANGEEYLLLGDVAWKMRNVDQVRERARLETIIADEDRSAVLGQLAMLNALKELNPKLHIVPGHDGAAVNALIDSGAMVRGFQ